MTPTEKKEPAITVNRTEERRRKWPVEAAFRSKDGWDFILHGSWTNVEIMVDAAEDKPVDALDGNGMLASPWYRVKEANFFPQDLASVDFCPIFPCRHTSRAAFGCYASHLSKASK